MTQPTRIYRHSSAGTDWAALLLGAGLGLTLALQLTTVRKSDFTSLYGIEHVQVNAAGDLSLRGGFYDGSVKPWRIGVVNPQNREEVVETFEISDGAIATSGTYERGAHIHDPLNGLIAIGAKSATVTGPFGWLCDAMATALMVAGEDGAKYFAQAELEGYQVFVVDRHENTTWSI